MLEHHISSTSYLRFIPRPRNPDRHIQTVAKMTSSSQLASQSFLPLCIMLLFVKTFRLKPDSRGASRNRWRTRWRKGADLTIDRSDLEQWVAVACPVCNWLSRIHQHIIRIDTPVDWCDSPEVSVVTFNTVWSSFHTICGIVVLTWFGGSVLLFKFLGRPF